MSSSTFNERSPSQATTSSLEPQQSLPESPTKLTAASKGSPLVSDGTKIEATENEVQPKTLPQTESRSDKGKHRSLEGAEGDGEDTEEKGDTLLPQTEESQGGSFSGPDQSHDLDPLADQVQKSSLNESLTQGSRDEDGGNQMDMLIYHRTEFRSKIDASGRLSKTKIKSRAEGNFTATMSKSEGVCFTHLDRQSKFGRHCFYVYLRTLSKDGRLFKEKSLRLSKGTRYFDVVLQPNSVQLDPDFEAYLQETTTNELIKEINSYSKQYPDAFWCTLYYMNDVPLTLGNWEAFDEP